MAEPVESKMRTSTALQQRSPESAIQRERWTRQNGAGGMAGAPYWRAAITLRSTQDALSEGVRGNVR